MTASALQRAQESLRIHDIYIVGHRLWIAADFIPHIHSETVYAQTRHGAQDVHQLLNIENPGADSEDSNYKIVRFMIDTGFRFVAESGSTKPGQESPAVPPEDETDTEDIRAELRATFCAEYRILSENIADDEEALRVFKEQNSLYHVWPYWREFVQNTLARSRMPQVMLPMFRLPASALKQKQQEK